MSAQPAKARTPSSVGLFGKLVFAIVIAALVVAIAVIGERTIGMSALALAIVAALAVNMAFVVMTKRRLDRELNAVRNQTENLARYEAEMDARLRKLDAILDHLSRQGGGPAPAQLSTDFAADLNAAAREVSALKERVTQLEARPPAASEPEMPRPDEASNDTGSHRTPRPERARSSRADTAKGAKSTPGIDDLMLQLQPHVTLPDRRPDLLEASFAMRLADGSVVKSEQFMAAARYGGLMPEIDRKLVASAIRVLDALPEAQRDTRILVRLTAETFSTNASARAVVDEVNGARHLFDRLIVELPHRQWTSLDATARDRFVAIADAGFALAIGQVESSHFDARELQRVGVRLLRAPTDILLHASNAEDGSASEGETIVSEARGASLRVAATGVARDDSARRLADLGIDLAQGELFAPPRRIKPELVARPDGARSAA